MCVALGWLHLEKEREQKVHLKTILYLLCASLQCYHLSASVVVFFCIKIERWILHCVSELHRTGQRERERGSFEDNGVKLIGAIHFHTSFLFVKILMVMMIVVMILMMVVMMIKLIYVKHFPQSASRLEGCLLYGGVAKTLS